ncbi:MAG TPA: hypothetical protein VH092_37795 [Urbifossiella sp.]|jgi:hypothetical protein|nr:hypothetical protein [Urbifossiella sp.]
MLDDPLVIAAAQFGPLALVGVIVGQMVFKALAPTAFAAVSSVAGYFTKPAPAAPSSPLATPVAPSPHPVLDGLLKAFFGKTAPAAADAHPDLLTAIRDEVTKLVPPVAPPATTPAG